MFISARSYVDVSCFLGGYVPFSANSQPIGDSVILSVHVIMCTCDVFRVGTYFSQPIGDFVIFINAGHYVDVSCFLGCVYTYLSQSIGDSVMFIYQCGSLCGRFVFTGWVKHTFLSQSGTLLCLSVRWYRLMIITDKKELRVMRTILRQK